MIVVQANQVSIGDEVIRGRIDVLALQGPFWVLVWSLSVAILLQVLKNIGTLWVK